jgi:glutamine synthetase
VRVVPLVSVPRRQQQLEKLESEGVGLVPILMGFLAHVDSPASGCGVDLAGEVRMKPDLSSARVLPWCKSHAVAMGDLWLGDAPWELCPRNCLKSLLRSIGVARTGLGFQVGFESEFILLKPDKDGDFPGVPVDRLGYCSSRKFGAQSHIISQMADYICEMGIEVLQIHAESAFGQFEISTLHTDPLQACDDLLLTRECICAVAHESKIEATFLPKTFETCAGSGSHCHISLHRDGCNLAFEESRQGPVASFMAGILEHLPGLLALTAPSPNSFRRIAPGTWSGAFCCWGIENKEAPLRLCRSPSAGGEFLHFELKSFDATANPFVGLAAVLAAGVAGISADMILPLPINVDPALLEDAVRDGLGALPLPLSPLSAISALRGEKGLLIREAVGPRMVQVITAVHEAEADHFQYGLSQELRELWDKY